MSEAPLITCYARVIDNLSGKQILDYTDLNRNNAWYYGKCNGFTGGESEYIVEFDIWNNEPAFNGGATQIDCKDATSCYFTVYPSRESINEEYTNSLFNIEGSFMHARCLTSGFKEFKPIKRKSMSLLAEGNMNPNINTLQGKGDHTVIQTKIVLPANSGLVNERHDFVFVFSYNYD